jgi:hypothetical protein
MFLELAELFPKLAELFRCTGRKFFWDLATLLTYDYKQFLVQENFYYLGNGNV